MTDPAVVKGAIEDFASCIEEFSAINAKAGK
jgi:hypothetical protein